MKNKIFTTLLLLLFIATQVNAATRNYIGSGSVDWNDATKWHGNILPGALDDVNIIPTGATTITITASTTVKSIFITPNPAYDVTINIDSGVTLTISGNLRFPNNSPITSTVNIGMGSLVCNDILFAGGINQNDIINITTGSLICNKIDFGTAGAINNRVHAINVGDGSLKSNEIKMYASSDTTITNSITVGSGELSSKIINMASCALCDSTNKILVTGAGTVNIDSTIGGTSTNNGTIDVGANGIRSFSDSGTQHIQSGSYTNVQFSGTGNKILSGDITINKLIWSGNSTLDTNGHTISFASNGTLIYQDTTNAYFYVSGNEWPNVNPPSNVVVNLTGNASPSVTLGNNKTISDTLNMIAGSLALSDKTLILNGTILGTGSLSANGISSNLVIGGSGDFGSIYMNQDTAGKTNCLNNFTFNRISSGTLSLGDTMQVIGVITATEGILTTNDKLILAATSPTSYGQMSGTGSGNISGNVEVQKVLEDIVSGWRHIGLPAQNTIDKINGLQVQTTSNPKTNQHNVYWWNASENSNRIAEGWEVATSTDNETKAYSVYNDTANTGIHDINLNISIEGALTQSDYTVNLENNRDSSGVNGTSEEYGWNFIPNRFASNIDVSDLIGDGDFGSGYKAIHVWDRAANQYVGINASSLINYSTPASISTDNNIAPWQGFWVKADSIGQSIQVKKSHQTTNMTDARQFMKSGRDFMRLNVHDTKGLTDQIAVMFAIDATENFDGDKDLYKLKSLNGDVPTLYILQNNVQQSATAFPYTKKRTVTLGFESFTNNQSYTFSPEFDNFDYPGDIILEDLKTGALTDLRTATYEFTHDNSYDAQRFLLHFNMKENTSSVNTDINTQKTYVYGGNEGISVYYSNGGSESDGAVSIFNALGQQVYQQNSVKNGQTLTFKPTAPVQVYLITITSNNITKTHKLLY